ncbi:MAG: NADH-dependent [FeFe] hydrogenase, group A6 [Oscillospiraceae bacterium]|nr:NADH-dependent [FeFe] hydrogenase, group A6 [Oscillospiraceae bacterium]
MYQIKINDIAYSVPEGSTILEAARYAGINIPTLCYLKDLNEIGACRVCVVEVKGARSLVAACMYPVNDGMEIYTNSPAVLESRKTTLQLLLSVHNRKCLSCVRSGNCEFQTLCHDLGVEDEGAYDGAWPEITYDDSTAHMIRDNSKCVLCRRCVAACEGQTAVIGPNGRGFDTHIACAFEQDLADVACISCGQCIVNCPTGALTEKDSTAEVMAAIADPDKFVVVQTAPAIRATLGECFDLPIGTNVKGKMVAALRRLGFDRVFDTNFGADLTIMEEGTEFLHRMQEGGVLPMITSCSPGWVKYIEYFYPELLPHLSSCKSPQSMQGAVTKSWFAEKAGIDPKKIVSVSIMPCTAKKFEIHRDDMNGAGEDLMDNDYVLTTRELGRLIKQCGIDFVNLPDEEFDPCMDIASGAGAIFGTSGGVMEAALRTVADNLTGEDLKAVDYHEVRGMEEIKEASYEIAGQTIKVAVASGMKNAKVLLEKIKHGEADYQFIEIMGCPGGCINGGGQPIQPAVVRNFTDYRGKRAEALYAEDRNLPLRKSHDNPLIQQIYKEYLGEPGSEKAHHLLHTTYIARPKYKK